MNRSLTPKEKFTFVFLALIVVIALWYLLFFSRAKEEISRLNTDQTQFETDKEKLMVEFTNYNKWKKLGVDIQNKTDDFPKIADYNNIQDLTAELNTILADSTWFSFSFAQRITPEEQNKDCYRRDVALQFSTSSYESARAILQKLNESQYGCLIQDVDITRAIDSAGASSVSVNAALSFFEYAKRDPAKAATDAGEEPAA